MTIAVRALSRSGRGVSAAREATVDRASGTLMARVIPVGDEADSKSFSNGHESESLFQTGD